MFSLKWNTSPGNWTNTYLITCVIINAGLSQYWSRTHLTLIIGLKGRKECNVFCHHLHTNTLYFLPSSPGHLGKLLTRFKLRSRLRVIRESTFERNKESKSDAFIMYGPGEMYVCLHQALSLRYLLNRCIYKFPTLSASFFPQSRIGIPRKTLGSVKWDM